ncbi:hypothetical protein [Mycolicibacter icosiumassiliensis]|uniref:hypothetical protein n=1 Tax=Mycolicibacter icosiumassiliensis TaxID=1792835 RepID=UPI00082CF0DD|nr:hypothetical protein [Mycolicibacter icosiumassiliensis]
MSTTTSPFLSYSNAFAAYANGTNAASMRLCAAMYTEPALNHEAVRSLHTVSYHFFHLNRQALSLIAQLDQASAWDTSLNREYAGSEYVDVLSSCRRECLTKHALLTAARGEVLALVPYVTGTAAQAVGQVLDLIDDMQCRLKSAGGDHV